MKKLLVAGAVGAGLLLLLNQHKKKKEETAPPLEGGFSIRPAEYGPGPRAITWNGGPAGVSRAQIAWTVILNNTGNQDLTAIVLSIDANFADGSIRTGTFTNGGASPLFTLPKGVSLTKQVSLYIYDTDPAGVVTAKGYIVTPIDTTPKTQSQAIATIETKSSYTWSGSFGAGSA